MEKLKEILDEKSVVSGGIKYRKQVANILQGKHKELAKGEIFKQELAHAEHLEEKEKNPDFGFEVLHYSVSEASGSIQIKVLNKKKTAAKVRVASIDAEAKAGDDYEAIDEVLEFKSGEGSKFVKVIINDDDNWEPDEDFFVQLYNPVGGLELVGKDTRTRVTIIDDDKPGQICFEEQKQIIILAGKEKVECEVKILRKNGADGVVTVDYETI